MKAITAIFAALVGTALVVTGCASTDFVPYDPNTRYRVDDSSSGFALTVDYSRRVFIFEPEAVREACRNAFATIAQDVAAKRGRRIRPIEEQQIAVRIGRNEHSNVSFCTATGPVAWQ